MKLFPGREYAWQVQLCIESREAEHSRGFSVPNSRCYTDRLTVLYQVPTAVLSFSLAAGSKFAPSFRVTTSLVNLVRKLQQRPLSFTHLHHTPFIIHVTHFLPSARLFSVRDTFTLSNNIHHRPSSWKRSFIRNSVYSVCLHISRLQTRNLVFHTKDGHYRDGLRSQRRL